MSLTEKLRKHAWIADKKGKPHCNLLHEAADEITRLEAHNRKLRVKNANAALNDVMSACEKDPSVLEYLRPELERMARLIRKEEPKNGLGA